MRTRKNSPRPRASQCRYDLPGEAHRSPPPNHANLASFDEAHDEVLDRSGQRVNGSRRKFGKDYIRLDGFSKGPLRSISTHRKTAPALHRTGEAGR